MAHTIRNDSGDASERRRLARQLREQRRTRRDNRPGYGRTDFNAHPILKELQASR